MNIREIKKGDKILHSHMGSNPPVSGIVKESPIQGRGIRSTLLVDVKGSEVGLSILKMHWIRPAASCKTAAGMIIIKIDLRNSDIRKKPREP
jgi:hypothetical protein